jgi:transaldolase
MANLLDQLKTMTTVVSDTGDINAIKQYKPTDATTNPSLIGAAAEMPEYQPIVDGVLTEAREKNPDADDKEVAAAAFKTLAVAFGRKILEIVPGRVSTEVDARLSYDTEGSLAAARDIIKQYNAAGVGNERVLIKLASTWEGIRAAEILEKEGIHCNMTLLFGLHQAAACAEAKVTLISPFVGRILDWHKANEPNKNFDGPNDPGVHSVTEIYHYYKKFDYKTVVMGASFRNMGEIIEIAGCDLLTIAPKLLHELQTTEGTLQRKLDPATSKNDPIEKISVDKATFDKMHAENQMAHDKLKEGIEGFSEALEDLEKLLAKRLSELPKPEAVGAK